MLCAVTRAFYKDILQEVPQLLSRHQRFCFHTECKSIDTDKKPMTCGQCRDVAYCSRECQVADWKAIHKHECRGQ